MFTLSRKYDKINNKIDKQINKLDKYRNQVTKIVCGIVDANKENTDFIYSKNTN